MIVELCRRESIIRGSEIFLQVASYYRTYDHVSNSREHQIDFFVINNALSVSS